MDYKLVPNSGIQFLQFDVDIARVGRFTRTFIERQQRSTGTDEATPRVQLLQAWNDLDPDGEPPHRTEPGDKEYDISKERALEPFLERWTPVPYLGLLSGRGGANERRFAAGPTNWARVYVAAAEHPDVGRTHHVIFAFDTELAERVKGRPYAAPEPADANSQQTFELAHRMSEMGWFVSDPLANDSGIVIADFQAWIDEWIEESFRDVKQRQRPGRLLTPDDLPYRCEHLARYITLLALLHEVIPRHSVQLINVTDRTTFVSVDLVLDVGNSRTCGVLIETYPNDDAPELNNSIALQLRDLQRPYRVYSDPFDSHVQLAECRFGPTHLSRRSGRARPAFLWPSIARIGPEAARIRDDAGEREALSGMSSPKRYLWDVGLVNQPWRFQAADYGHDGTPPQIERMVCRFVNTRGDVLRQVESDEKLYASLASPSERATLRQSADRLGFSRSSFFTFMVAEIIYQALTQVNNPQIRGARAHKDAPRRLNKIILSIPTAMPVREQRLLRSRSCGAIRLIWDLMGWTESPPRGLSVPDVHVAWDEASCAQFVYLYGEVKEKFAGNISSFFELIGRPRARRPDTQSPPQATAPEASLRMASIDIGGGTTDLMITTYHVDGNRAIVPSQNFREGFRLAGDDILKAVIERAVLPAIERALIAADVRAPREVLKNCFGGNRANMSETEKQARREFVLRVLQPAALALLGLAESGIEAGEGPKVLLRESFSSGATRTAPNDAEWDRVARYLELPAARAGSARFRVQDVAVVYEAGAIRASVESALDSVFENVAEAIHHFDCDLVLLSGRPSRLPAIVDLFLNKLGVSPDRVVPLHRYRAGTWYPFRARDNVRVGDPKTITVVGCMLCALAERQITNFTLYTHRLKMRSTARFIGELELDGKLLASRVAFADPRDLERAPQRAEMQYFAPLRIGYRQLPWERWIATPLYRLKMIGGAARERIPLPVRVVLERGAPEDVASYEDQSFSPNESLWEELKIDSADDRDGGNVRRHFALPMDTLWAEGGYWLDTGILTVV